MLSTPTFRNDSNVISSVFSDICRNHIGELELLSLSVIHMADVKVAFNDVIQSDRDCEVEVVV